jgi:hypothetical protein
MRISASGTRNSSAGFEIELDACPGIILLVSELAPPDGNRACSWREGRR